MTENENIGRDIGRYRVLEEIGRGGMATVYRAIDTSLEREVALKLLHPYLTSHEESRTRFKREAQAVARLKHDSVLEIYDYSAGERGDVFIVMELVQGTTLRRLLEDRNGEPVPAEAAALIIIPVCAALAHAHENGVVHRDVKPENILIGPEGDIKLSDFGIAHMAGASQMTVTGQILGSPAYMSPEHVEMAELDARADIFSVGIILYEIAVGRAPFEGANPHAVLKKIVEGKFSDPVTANPGIGHFLSKTINRCLRYEPSERFETAAALGEALKEMLVAMGLDQPREDLRAFFAAPEEWFESRKSDIVHQTLNWGVVARKKKRSREAMDHFNRVLALDPGNERAIEAVAGMNRRKRLRTVLERAAVIIPVVIAIIGLVWGLSRKATPAPGPAPAPREHGIAESMIADEPPEADTGPPPEPQDTTDATAATPIAPDTSTASKPPRTRKRPKPDDALATVRRVVFTPHPLAVEIVIDGDARFPFGPANRFRELPTGEHTISFIPNDRRRFVEETWKVTIPEGDAPYQFRKRLKWRPASVLIESNVEATVTIPGRVSNRSNREFSVTIKDGPSEKLSVLVSRDGYVPQTKPLNINAGELTKLAVNLVKKND